MTMEFEHNLDSSIIMNENRSYLVRHLRNKPFEICSIEAEKNTDEFLTSMFNNFYRLPQDVLPENCRFAFNNLLTDVFVIEEKPKIRSIITTNDIQRDLFDLKENGLLELYGIKEKDIKKLKPPFRFQLSFPYMIYIISSKYDRDYLNNRYHHIYKFHKLSLFYRMSPLKTIYDHLLLPNLPNLSSEGGFCTGHEGHNSEGYETHYELCQDVIDKFWNTSFNLDLSSVETKYMKSDSRISNYLNWQYNSLKDPFFINDISWIKYEYNLHGFLNHTFQYHNYNDNQIDPNTYQLYENTKKIFSVSKPISRKISCNMTTYNFAFKNGFLSVGDVININDKVYYIDSFLVDSKNNLKTVMVYDENNNYLGFDCIGKSEKENIIYKIEDYLDTIKFNKSNYPEKIFIDDRIGELKNGDFIQYNKEIIQISKIRNKNGYIEILSYKNNNDTISIILNNITKSKISKITDFKLKDCIMEIGKSYAVFLDRRLYPTSFIFSIINYNLILKNINFINNKFYFGFENSNGDTVDYYEDAHGLVNVKEYSENLNFEKITLFTIDHELYYNVNNLFTRLKNDRTILSLDNINNQNIDPYYIVESFYKVLDFNKHSLTLRKEFCNYLLESIIGPAYIQFQSVATAAYLKNFNYYSVVSNKNISFSIGDYVVHADWKTPEEMLKIKKIVNIVLKPPKGKTLENIHEGNIFFILEDSEQNQSYVEYVDINTMFIYDGCIRKSISSYKNLNIGDKVTIKERNPLFLKKNVFYIAAFVEDIHSDIPFVLLSNYTLVRYSKFIKNYNVISKDDKSYNRLKLSTVNVNNIKFQNGDSIYRKYYCIRNNKVVYNFVICMYTSSNNKKVLKEFSLIGHYCMNKSFSYNYDNKEVERIGFIMERFNVKNYNNYLYDERENIENHGKMVYKLNRIFDNYNTMIPDLKVKSSYYSVYEDEVSEERE